MKACKTRSPLATRRGRNTILPPAEMLAGRHRKKAAPGAEKK